jgi:hypothetical protein
MNTKPGIFRHPYLFTGLLFLMILFFALFLSWPREYYMFLLLIYFLISIGIKLDDISRQIASTRNSLPQLLSALGTITTHLNNINATLSIPDDPEDSKNAKADDAGFEND